MPQRLALARSAKLFAEIHQFFQGLGGTSRREFVQSLGAEAIRLVAAFAIKRRRGLVDMLAQMKPVEDLPGVLPLSIGLALPL